jgi:alkyl hydroperoxide reductase subunit AhpC
VRASFLNAGERWPVESCHHEWPWPDDIKRTGELTIGFDNSIGRPYGDRVFKEAIFEFNKLSNTHKLGVRFAPAPRDTSFWQGTRLPACAVGGIYVIVKPITGARKRRAGEAGNFYNCRADALPGKPDKRRPLMSLRINDEAPNFTAETTQGTINFHDWIGNGWAILFSHPKDFTPVCTTELGYMAGLMPEFQKRNTKIIGLSVDPVGDHTRWSKDIEETQGHRVTYPLIGDPELKVAKAYDMLGAEAGDSAAGRTAATNATVRAVFVVGPDKKIKAMLTYPMTTGRNFDEVVRILDSVQLTAKHQVATPVNWKPGDDVIIAGSVSDDEAKKRYPQGWRAPRPYLRYVPQPH